MKPRSPSTMAMAPPFTIPLYLDGKDGSLLQVGFQYIPGVGIVEMLLQVCHGLRFCLGSGLSYGVFRDFVSSCNNSSFIILHPFFDSCPYVLYVSTSIA